MHGVMLFQGTANKIEGGGREREVSDFSQRVILFPICALSIYNRK